ncbi:MAG: EAL domain-containing protein [Thermodesulfobacteriota bacterium]|nr:EAL domain-containing protein [Thermodesulfobacteriota bacterium]
MDSMGQTLHYNVKLMKSRVTKYAVYGVLIAVTAVIIATLATSFMNTGAVSVEGIFQAQKSNMTLWVLDVMPFIFAFWGQYVSSKIVHEASTMVRDQTQELRQQTAALEYQAMHDATHDSLTDLPNRVLLCDRLEQAISNAHRSQQILAFIILDLDRFKEINDTLGHFNGDRLLKQVAARLQRVVRGSDTLARLGGDEFGILLPAINRSDDIYTVIKKIQKVFKSPFRMEGLTLDVQASIGGVLYPEHGKDIDTIMQRADVAMYVAKQDNCGFSIYTTKMDKHSPKRLTLMGELRQAFDRNELELYYQPKISVHKDRISGVEALVRWNHAVHGLMTPDEFIPLAERSGLIKQLSWWVLQNALAQAVLWHEKGIAIGVAVNISPFILLDPELPEAIIGLLSSHKLPEGTLTLEITETSVLKDPDLALEILLRLADMGIIISIDDYGTGYSSLSYLRKMPASEVKIDKSFVIDMLKNDNDAVIVRATIELAHNLGMKVVAEGVENKETAARLKELNCDILQGYYFSRPLAIGDFTRWFASCRFS